MLVDMGRGVVLIGVPGPVSQERASAGPAYEPSGATPPCAILGLHRQEAPRVVLEIVDAQDHDLVGVRLGSDRLALGGGLCAVLGPHRRLAVGDPLAPDRGALDGGAERVARLVERLELVLVAEDGGRHGPIAVVAEVVVVELDAVRVGLELQPHGGALTGERDLDQALALVRVDAPFWVLTRRRNTCHSEREQRDGDSEPPPRTHDLHDDLPRLTPGIKSKVRMKRQSARRTAAFLRPKWSVSQRQISRSRCCSG